MISLYFPSGDSKAHFINARPYARGISGREPTFAAGYIELIYTFYRLFGWGLRQSYLRVPGSIDEGLRDALVPALDVSTHASRMPVTPGCLDQ